MARVVLVQPPHRDTFGYSMPPLGILHAGAAARAAGHEVRFLDFALMVRRGELPAATRVEAASLAARCAARILAERPDALGLGAMISSMPAALHLAAEVARLRPELPVILGGQGPETVEEAIIARHPAVDAVAVGEADFTLAEWLDRVHEPGAWRNVAGLVVRAGAGGGPLRTPARALLVPLDAVLPPAWDLAEPPSAYAAAAGEASAMFPIDLGRGCTYACSFCTTPVFWGRTARHLSAARAADELDRLAALPGIGCAYVTHDLFTFDRQRVLDICAEKQRRVNRLPWECRTRIDLVDAELLAAMAAADCRRILYGVESDSPAVLARVNKGGRAATTDVRATLALASRLGVASILGVMAGVPGETADDVEASLQLMAQAAVRNGVSLSLHWFNVTPGNGRAAETDTLRLRPGLHADLVRGHDLPAGHVTPGQARLIADDAEIFAAFRVFAPDDGLPGTSARDLYLLTRNAHLLLEVLPRTLRALALSQRATLRDVLTAFLRRTAEEAPAEAWDEPLVLRRATGVARLAIEARSCGDPRVAALADYEEALIGADAAGTPRVVRFAVDPLPLVRALDGGAAELPPAGGGGTVMFAREGETMRAFALSPFLADVAEGLASADLAARWPEADARLVHEARRRLHQLASRAAPGREASGRAGQSG